MKKRHLFVAAASMIALIAVSNAATYTLSTGNTVDANGFGNSQGIAFQNSADVSLAGPGIVGFGIFSIADVLISTSTGEQLISGFTGFGGAPTAPFTAPGFTQNRGTFAVTSSGIVGGSAFNGSLIYLFVGNGTTYANSTEFGVFKTSHTFNAADDPTPTPILLAVNQTTITDVLLGSTTADLKTRGTDGSVTQGYLTATPIPEPSAALLGALGALGLLRRRRI